MSQPNELTNNLVNSAAQSETNDANGSPLQAQAKSGADKSEATGLYTMIVGCYIAAIIISIAGASKFVAIGPFTLSGGTLVWPITFVFNDIFTEVYGYGRSRQIIWTGMGVQIFAAFIYWLIGALPAASFWHRQSEYDMILGQAPRIVLACLLAYFWGEYTNSVAISRLKFMQKGAGGLSQSYRFVLSTALGEFVDTAIFFPVGFLGTVPVIDLLKTMGCIYIAKVVYEIIALPASTRLANYIKRKENVDVIDNPSMTSYSPVLTFTAEG